MADEIDDPHETDVFAAQRPASYQFVQFDTVQGITRITLNRPPANVLSVEMMDELNQALDSLEYAREVKLVVLASSGSYFSAGFELNDHLGDRAYLMLEGFRRIFEGLAKIDKPTLAVVAGPALGAGCLLAAGCDIVLAAAGKAKFGQPEVRAGVFNAMSAALLPRIVGRKKAFEMMLLGATLAAADAERAGLATRAVPDERLEAEVAALIQRFQEGSAAVLQLTRRAIAGALDLPLDEAVRHTEDVYLNQLLATEDAEEGLKAIIEKRKPAFKDR
jgi:cyclohexa-1,5-dienecarbonyl-CoA hydratase